MSSACNAWGPNGARCEIRYRRVRKWGDPTVVLRPWGTDHLQGSS